MEGLGDRFGRLLGRILEARGDFWEVKWKKKGNRNEESKKEQKGCKKNDGNASGGGSGMAAET